METITRESKHFIHACANGDLDFAKELIERYNNIDISVNSEAAFISACKNGHLHVAQWLYQIKPELNLTSSDHSAFRYACIKRNLDVAEWLKSLNPNLYSICYDDDNTYKCYLIDGLDIYSYY